MLCACAGSGIHLEGKLPLLSGLLWVVLSALTTGINEAWYLDHGVCHSHVLAGCHDSDNNHARSCDHDTEMCVCVCVCARARMCVCDLVLAGVSNPRFIQSDWTLYYSHDPFAGLSTTQLQFNLGGK